LSTVKLDFWLPRRFPLTLGVALTYGRSVVQSPGALVQYTYHAVADKQVTGRRDIERESPICGS
jgi:hypothetical protein